MKVGQVCEDDEVALTGGSIPMFCRLPAVPRRDVPRHDGQQRLCSLLRHVAVDLRPRRSGL